MAGYVYETHAVKDPLLPFIFHRDFLVAHRVSLPNWHENIEILYCTQGAGQVRCGAELLPMTPGDIFVINTNTPHFISSEEQVIYHCLIVDSEFCRSNGLPVSQLYFQKHIRDPHLNAAFQQVADAFAGYAEQSICTVADIRYCVLGLLRQLCKNYIVSHASDSRSPSSEHIKKALIYIRKNLSSPISLDNISSHVGISKYHLAREFKAFTGRTVISTVNLIRCMEAKRMIEGGMRISDAAEACGFENLSYFSRTFKKIFHAPPSCSKPT